MSGNTQIGRLLATRFAPFDGTPHSEGRVVFWHDEVGEFSEEVDSIVGPEAENEALRDVELVRLERNPFALEIPDHACRTNHQIPGICGRQTAGQ